LAANALASAVIIACRRVEAEADRTSGWACRLARFALMDRQRKKSPGSMPRLIRTWFWEFKRIGIWRRTGRYRHRQGTRASANTSGPDFNQALRPGEIADQDPHRTKKTCFFCRTGFKERTP